jgi:Glycosyl transferase family 2
VLSPRSADVLLGDYVVFNTGAITGQYPVTKLRHVSGSATGAIGSCQGLEGGDSMDDSALQEVPFISFVVIAYNEERNIGNTLAAISGLNDLAEHEIIVVNDGSSDGTGRIVADVAAKNPRVQLIELSENRGRGSARNTGVTAARGGLIATVDADILLPLDWLVRSLAAIGDHDAVGGTAVPDGDVAYLYKRFRLVPRVVGGTATVAGSNGLYRREVFDLATFDPALREGEDSALNHALNRQGFSCVTIPGLVVEHEEDKTLVTSLRWLFDIGRGATRQLITYREVRQPDLVTAGFMGAAAVGIGLAARRHPLAGAAVPLGFILAASAQHVRSRFKAPASQWTRVAPAIGVDSAMLTAYFAGRLVGLTALWRRRKS